MSGFALIRDGARERNVGTENMTSISLRDVRKLIKDKSIGESVLDAVDKLLGLVIVFSPVALGPTALPLLGLIEPKNELIRTFKDAARKISKSEPADYLDQASRMAAANAMLMYTAFFDAFRQVWPRFVAEFKLTEADREAFLARALVHRVEPSLTSLEISLPHPAALGYLGSTVRLEAYTQMTLRLRKHADSFPPTRGREDEVGRVLSEIPKLAERLYQAEYMGLAVEFSQFFTWTVLRDQAARDKALQQTIGGIQTLADDQRTWFELIARAMHDQDLGLRELSTAIAQLPRLAIAGTDHSGVQEIADELHRTYASSLRKEIIDDQFEVDDSGPRLRFPRKIDAFVPQAYRVTRYDKDRRIERDDQWRTLEVRHDVGAFIMRYLESPYSVQLPLLVLGHPGSGKSILTEMLAGHLAYPGYTTIRVKLRDINPDMTFLKLLEDQVQNDTGGLSPLPAALRRNG
jgi:hypothetical protein